VRPPVTCTSRQAQPVISNHRRRFRITVGDFESSAALDDFEVAGTRNAASRSMQVKLHPLGGSRPVRARHSPEAPPRPTVTRSKPLCAIPAPSDGRHSSPPPAAPSAAASRSVPAAAAPGSNSSAVHGVGSASGGGRDRGTLRLPVDLGCWAR
jgi:hypothetical protein